MDNQTNWLTNNDISSWHGVTVDNGRVTGLVLSQNNLTGEIPLALVELNDMDRLKLARNALSGPIPTELGSLTGLTILEFMLNKLSGPITAELGNLGKNRVAVYSVQ